METHRIAVISDTHGLLRPEVLEKLEGCEAILHAGDLGRPDILAKLTEISPVWAVRGNVDREWADGLPGELEVTLSGFRIYITHNRKQIRKDLAGIDIVIYGHSHKYEECREGGILYLNPGSCGPRRFRLPVTMAVLTLYPEGHRAETERVDCMSAAVSVQGGIGSEAVLGQKDIGSEAVPGSGRGGSGAVSAGSEPDSWPETDVDMHRLVKAVMKDVRAGRTVAGIAARHHVKEELAEEICRYYVTHPGVDVDGILDRMERKNL